MNKNVKHIERIINLIETEYKTKNNLFLFQKVKSHTKIKGNDRVDYLVRTIVENKIKKDNEEKKNDEEQIYEEIDFKYINIETLKNSDRNYLRNKMMLEKKIDNKILSILTLMKLSEVIIYLKIITDWLHKPDKQYLHKTTLWCKGCRAKLDVEHLCKCSDLDRRDENGNIIFNGKIKLKIFFKKIGNIEMIKKMLKTINKVMRRSKLRILKDVF